MSNPFELFGKVLLAGIKIIGYLVVCIIQVIWDIVCRKPDKVGDAVGEFGRGVVDAFVDIFKES